MLVRISLMGLLAALALGCGGAPGPTVVVSRPLAQPVSFEAAGDKVSGLLYAPAAAKALPAVIVVHEDYGLNDWVKEEAAALARQGYVVLAVDLFDGKVFTDLMDAHIMESRLESKKVVAQLQGAVNFLAAQPNVDAGKIAMLGWGSGGGYALEAAIAEPRLRAVVTCYGRVPTAPASLASLQGAVLGIFAGKDLGISPETRTQFAAAMKQAGKKLAGPHVYDDLPHGFLNPAALPEPTPAQQAAVADARQQIRQFLATELR